MPLVKLLDCTKRKYNLPEWVKPYIYKYAKENPVSSVRFAISLIDVKRKKGEITKSSVKLPNGTTFAVESILKILNLFFYGEENMARIETAWANSSADRNAVYESHYMELAELDFKRARAIKNLVEGLGQTMGDQPDSVTRSFDRIYKIESWHDRIIATGLVLNCSYARTFGNIFYKVFYPVAPEYMRSFKKAFDTRKNERWDTIEAKRLINNNLVERDHVIELTRNVLSTVQYTIESNIILAKELGLEKEAGLLGDISIAYPFQMLSDLGVKTDIDEEVSLVKRNK